MMIIMRKEWGRRDFEYVYVHVCVTGREWEGRGAVVLGNLISRDLNGK